MTVPAISPTNWSSFVVSAPGKLILFGEHAAVYGKTAIAGSLDLRAYALVTQSSLVHLVFPDIDIDLELDYLKLPQIYPGQLQHPADVPTILSPGIAKQIPDEMGPGRTAIMTFIYLYGCLVADNPTGCGGFTMVIRSMVPVGAGLGSSAAFNVTLAAALLRLTGKLSSSELSEKDLELINEWAFQGEQVAHGTPSGIDNSVATYGRFLRYTKGQQPQNIEAQSALKVLITNTNVPKSTKALVAGVRQLYDKYPAVLGSIMDTVDEVARQAAEWVEQIKDQEELETKISDLVRLNHGLLNTLRVSHPALERVREITDRYGLASKLTGAGGGGCALTLVGQNIAEETLGEVIGELESNQCDCYQAVVGGKGVKFATKLPDEILDTTRFIGLAQTEFQKLH